MLASQYSKEPAAAQGGDIGFVERGAMMPNVRKPLLRCPSDRSATSSKQKWVFTVVMVVDKRRGLNLHPMCVMKLKQKSKMKRHPKNMIMIEGIRKKSFIDIR